MYLDAINQIGGVSPSVKSGSNLARSINLRQIWAPIYRSRFAVAAIVTSVIALAIVATLLIKPVYRATATVEIKAEAQKVLGTEDRNEQSGSSLDSERFLDTQLDIIRSRSTMVAVAQSLGLYNNNQFLSVMGLDPDDVKTGILTLAEAKREQVDSVLERNLRVSFSKDTRIAHIDFASADPRLAARIANSVADNYIRLNLARRFDASRYSLEFLRGQLREAQIRLANSEREALSYARGSRLIDASNGPNADNSQPRSLTTASLVDLNQALSEATAKRIAAEQKWDAARGGAVFNIPEVLANPAIQQLQQQRALLRGQYEDQLQTRREDYPAVRQLQARIAELTQQINALAGNVRGAIEHDYQTSLAQENALSGNLEGLKDRTLDEQSRGIRLSILQREANNNRRQLDALLTRYNDLNAQSGVQLNNLAVIDEAQVPTLPFWPSVPLNIALAIIVAAFLAGAYIVVRENLFDVVRTPEDVTSRLHLPLLGAVPAGQDLLIELADPKSAISESFGSIRTSLALTSSLGVPKSLMVSSTQAGEGKSTVCYGLATGLAKLGRSVVVIDADLRRPNVHRLFEQSNKIGMSSVLSGAETIDAALLRDVAQNIDIMAAGPVPPNPAELLAAGALRALVEQLGERYDHVLVDSAPVLGLADAPLVAASVEGMIFVIESARTSMRGVTNATNRLAQTGTPLIGVVLSRFDAGKSGYSYEYKYAYQYEYDKAKVGAG